MSLRYKPYTVNMGMQCVRFCFIMQEDNLAFTVQGGFRVWGLKHDTRTLTPEM